MIPQQQQKTGSHPKGHTTAKKKRDSPGDEKGCQNNIFHSTKSDNEPATNTEEA
jgi:hypothetical protein